jgi:hypothetical protein
MWRHLLLLIGLNLGVVAWAMDQDLRQRLADFPKQERRQAMAGLTAYTAGLPYNDAYDARIGAIVRFLSRQKPSADGIPPLVAWLQADPLPIRRVASLERPLAAILIPTVNARLDGPEPSTDLRWRGLFAWLTAPPDSTAEIALLLMGGGHLLGSVDRRRGMRDVLAFSRSAGLAGDSRLARRLAGHSWLVRGYGNNASKDPTAAASLAQTEQNWLAAQVRDAGLSPKLRLQLVSAWLEREVQARRRHAEIRLVSDETLVDAMELLGQAWPASDTKAERQFDQVLIAMDQLPRSDRWGAAVDALLAEIGTDAFLPERGDAALFTRRWYDRNWRPKSEQQSDPKVMHRLLIAWAAERRADEVALEFLSRSGAGAASIGLLFRLVSVGRGDLASQIIDKVNWDLSLSAAPFRSTGPGQIRFRRWLESLSDEARITLASMAVMVHEQASEPAHWRTLPTAQSPSLPQPTLLADLLEEANGLEFTSNKRADLLAQVAARFPDIGGPRYLERLAALPADGRPWQAQVDRAVYVGALIEGDGQLLDQTIQIVTNAENPQSALALIRGDLDRSWRSFAVWSERTPTGVAAVAGHLRALLTRSIAFAPKRSDRGRLGQQTLTVNLLSRQVDLLAEALEDAGVNLGLDDGGPEASISVGGVIRELSRWCTERDVEDATKQALLRELLASRAFLPWTGNDHRHLLTNCYRARLISDDAVVGEMGRLLLEAAEQPINDAVGMSKRLARAEQFDHAKQILALARPMAAGVGDQQALDKAEAELTPLYQEWVELQKAIKASFGANDF